MKKALYILLYFVHALLFAQAEEAFELGNNLYKEGNYKEAVQQWESILDENLHSSELYYNLGNGHFKLNNIGASIYYYEKALQLAPGDRDIKNNLSFAQNRLIDVIEPLPKSVFTKWYYNTIGLFSYDTWASIAVVTVFIFVLLFISYYYTRQSSKKRLFFSTSLSVLFLALVAFSFAYITHSNALQKNEGIIFSERVPVKNEPTNRSDAAFYLHEGSKVQIIDEDGDWYRIELADGNDGWVLKSDLKNL